MSIYGGGLDACMSEKFLNITCIGSFIHEVCCKAMYAVMLVILLYRAWTLICHIVGSPVKDQPPHTLSYTVCGFQFSQNFNERLCIWRIDAQYMLVSVLFSLEYDG